MLELLLYGQVPEARHSQLLNVLAGISAMQPERVIFRNALFEPTRIPAVSNVQKGGTQGLGVQSKGPPTGAKNANVDVYYTHLVKRVHEEDFGQVEGESQVTDAEGGWAMEYKDTPQPGKRATLLRTAGGAVVSKGNPEKYMRGLGFGFVFHPYSKDYIINLNAQLPGRVHNRRPPLRLQQHRSHSPSGSSLATRHTHQYHRDTTPGLCFLHATGSRWELYPRGQSLYCRELTCVDQDG